MLWLLGGRVLVSLRRSLFPSNDSWGSRMPPLHRLLPGVLAAALVVTTQHPVSAAVAAASVLPVVPNPPAAVVPAPAFSITSGTGPTTVSSAITQDTVWGPQRSPYLLTTSVTIGANASLTLLPGTVVKMGAGTKITVNGQLLSLGKPSNKVTVTSIKDDSVMGDSNGDGAATAPGRGDWTGIVIQPLSSQDLRPASVIDYTNFRYGGASSSLACQGAGMVDVGTRGRAVISDSSFTDAYVAGVSGGPGADGFIGVYRSYFARSQCGVDNYSGTGEYVGNDFAGPFGKAAFFAVSPQGGRFWYNKVPTSDIVIAEGGVDVRYNTLSSISSFGAPVLQWSEYRHNWWGRSIPANPPAVCMTSEEVAASQPPVSAHLDGVQCPNLPNVYLADGWKWNVFPALSSPPPGLPDSIARPYAATYGPVDTNRGVLSYGATDIVVNDAGAEFTATRTYLSDRAAIGDAGKGWRTSYSEAMGPASGGVSTMSLGGGGDLPFRSDASSGYVPAPGVSASYVSDGSGTKVTTADKTSYEFNTSGELTGVVLGDPGHKATVTRVAGKVSKVTGVSGRFLNYTRSAGLVSTIADSQGRSATYNYDAGSQLTSVVGVDGQSETYTYTGGKLSKVTSAAGVTRLAAGYDAQGRVSWVEQQGTGRADITYGSGTRTITQADGVVVTQELDDFGRLVTEKVGSSSRHLIYDGDGRILTEIRGVPSEPMTGYSPPAAVTFTDYRGDPAIQVDPLGRITRTTFNAAHDPVSVTDPDGAVTANEYGPQGRLTKVTDARGKSWLITYNAVGQRTSVTDPLLRVRSWTFEADGDPLTEVSEIGGTTTFETNALGRTVAITDPVGRRSTTTYTSWGAVASATTPRGGVTVLTYNPDRQLATKTDPRLKVTTYTYDALGRLKAIKDAENALTQFAYDPMGRPDTMTDARLGVYQQTYTPQGWVKTTTGPHGSTSTTSYDPAGRSVRVTDGLGQVTQTVLNRAGEVVRVDTPDGGQRFYEYDKVGRESKFTNAVGGVYASEYDPAGNLTKLTNPLGKFEQRTYDVIGRVKTVTDNALRTVTYDYSNSGRTETVTDALGLRSITDRDVAGQVVSVADGEGRTTSYAYDADGQVQTMTLPGGRAYVYDYDLAGNLIWQRDPVLAVVSANYDGVGRMTKRIFPDGSWEGFSYDALGNQTSHTNRNGKTWAFEYDGLSRVTKVTDPLLKATTVAYDVLGRATQVTDPTGVFEKTAYDPMGRPSVVSDAALYSTVTTFDLEGNPLTVTDPAGRAVTHTYDTLGQRLTTKYAAVMSPATYKYDEVGNLLSRTRDLKTLAQTYDVRDRVKTRVDARGNTTTLSYDLGGLLTTVARPSGRATTYTYWPSGLLKSAKEPGVAASQYTYSDADKLAKVVLPRGGSYDFTYDAAGNLNTQTDPLLKVTDFDYDPEGQLTKVTQPSGKTIVSTFDAVGRETSRTAGGAIRTFTYDDAGRLKSATTSGTAPATSTSMTYDLRGLLATSTDSAGLTTYTPEASGLIASVTPPTGGKLDFTYNAIGEVATVRGPVNLNYNYNGSGWLTGRTQQTGTTNASTTFGYDADGNVTSVAASGSSANATYDVDGLVASTTTTLAGVANPGEGTNTYARDTAGRLAGSTLTSGTTTVSTATYHWDDDGNRDVATSKLGTAAAVSTASTYDAAGRLTSSTTAGATTAYTYDDDGQLTGVDGPGTSGDATYAYDGFGELVSASVVGGSGTSAASYVHDALGRVVSRAGTGTVGTGTTAYGYRGPGAEPVSVAVGAGAPTSLVRDADGDLLSARSSAGVVSHALVNAHGDVLGWRAASNAAFVSTSVYDPFGVVSSLAGAGVGPGPESRLGFQGQVADPLSGLVEMGARAYQPGTGRFTSADVLVGDLTSPVTLNRYTYANASPLDFVDPTGRAGVPSKNHGYQGDRDSPSYAVWVWRMLRQSLSNHLDRVSQGAAGVADQVKAFQASTSDYVNGLAAPGWAVSAGAWIDAHSEQIHTALDVLGMVPVVGEAFDLANGALYLAEGDEFNAAISFAAMVPGVGSFASAARVSARYGDTALGLARTGSRQADDLIAGARGTAGVRGGIRQLDEGAGATRSIPADADLVGAPTAASRQLTPNAANGGDDLARVGRWMGKDEHAAMVKSGEVQVGGGGTTHVAYPATPSAYAAQAKPGSLYVEFDVPRASLFRGGAPGWAQIPSPRHVLARLAEKRGSPVQSPVPACNIVVVSSC